MFEKILIFFNFVNSWFGVCLKTIFREPGSETAAIVPEKKRSPSPHPALIRGPMKIWAANSAHGTYGRTLVA